MLWSRQQIFRLGPLFLPYISLFVLLILYRFFSQEVVTYRHAPLQIGQCFLKWERQFYLYALYNKNKPKSDQLWDDYANTYFQVICMILFYVGFFLSDMNLI